MQQQKIEKQHEVFYKEKDYDAILARYRRQQKLEFSQEELLLVAKALFLNEDYQRCIQTLSKIVPSYSTKILYQRQSLWFRSSYLLSRHTLPTQKELNTLYEIIAQFFKFQKGTPGQPFKNHHLQTMQNYRDFVSFLEKYTTSKIVYNQKMFKQQEDIDKSSHKLTGFPCNLISQQWLNDYSKMKKEVAHKTYLCPITNFSIINDIFETHQYSSQFDNYKNAYIFSANNNHKIISKKLWAFYCSIFAGDNQFAPVRRLYSQKPFNYSQYYSSQNSQTISLIPAAVSCQKQLSIFQLTANEFVSAELIPLVEQKYGVGQLKLSGNQEESFEVFYFGEKNQKWLGDWTKMLIYQKIELPDKLKSYPFFRFLDYRPLPLSVLEQPQSGLRGFENLGNSCYMSSCLQCISFTKEVVKYLTTIDITTQLLSKKKDQQKDGMVTFALSDVMKQLWKNGNYKFLSPYKFKKYFGHKNPMFQGKTQQDAHEFLLNLLNSVHQDIKLSNDKRLRSNSKLDITTNVDKVKDYFTRHEIEQNKSLVTDLFRGILHTKILCNNCSTASHAFDVFLSLSLPIPFVNYPTIKFYYVGHKARATSKFQLCLKNIKNMNDIFKVFQNQALTVKKDSKSSEITVNGSEGPAKKKYLLLIFNNQDDPLEIWNYGFNNSLSSKEITIDELLAFQKQLILYEIQEKKEQNQQLTLIEYKMSYPIFSKDKILGLPRFMYINGQKLKNQEAKIFRKLVIENDHENHIQESYVDDIKAYQWKEKSFSFEYSLTVYFRRQERLFLETNFIDRELNQISDIYSLKDCFEEMGKSDSLEDGWKCGKCSSNKGAQKKESIIETNNILIISLKRFQANGSKIKNMIQYPLENLNIAEWLQEGLVIANQIYDLYAVCLHQGTMEYGHYRAYCKHFVSKEWYQFDDERVKKIEPDQVITPHAYMLFYKRRDI